MSCNGNDVDETLSLKPTPDAEKGRVRRGESGVRKQGSKFISNSVFLPKDASKAQGYKLGFFMIFTFDVCISILYILGYTYFELSHIMNRLLTNSTLLPLARKISLGKIIVQIESKVTVWLLIQIFSERLEKCIIPPVWGYK